MTTLEAAERPSAPAPQALFAIVIFASATLVFLVQPMVAKLVLPLLGGGPSIWNTSLAFFQIALLAGYAYANLLQRVPNPKVQVAIHGVLLLAAALVLPLRVHEAFGPPTSEHPALWLVGVLAVSLGAPFAVLSATAPLVQAWYASAAHVHRGREPYALYAASNLGSLIALLAYPILVEPLLPLQAQTVGWSVGYLGFILLIGALGFYVARTRDLAPVNEAVEPAPPVAWKDRLSWLALAAIPSSLMLGVTAHITTDIASAPFLWVVPLALYLLTFVIAFQTKPAIGWETTLLLQGFAAAGAAVTMPFKVGILVMLVSVQLAGFFFTALMCHHALVARRPAPGRLTEFYLWMSLGGVVGGGFNAFVAPLIFNNIWEFPLVLAISCLVRPWGTRPRQWEMWRWITLVAVIAAATAAPLLARHQHVPDKATHLMLGMAAVGAFILRRRAIAYCAAIVAVLTAAYMLEGTASWRTTWRSFFGVLNQSQIQLSQLGGQVNMLAHGSTLHGAQATNPRFRCRPLTYYAPETPIGQVFLSTQARKPALDIGAVGLGAGTVAAYTRPGDRLTFFEIDPLVVRIATDPRYFSYTTTCAHGRIGYVIGDARFTLASQPAGAYDILLIDAFSSDSVPAHLLTVEAMRIFLSKLKPDGVLVLHLSNRNLELRRPAMAVVQAVGASALLQRHRAAEDSPMLWESSEDAMVVARTPEALAAFTADNRWTGIDPQGVKPWTDDYVNVPGALYRQLKDDYGFLP